MTRSCNIKQLLLTKYYFYAALLLIPFILMIPTIIERKTSLLFLFSLAIFVMGPVHIMIFHLAIYTKQVTPLNAKIIGNANADTHFIPVIVSLAAFTLPIFTLGILQLFFDNNTTGLIILVIGLTFLISHKYWIGIIYKKMLVKKYENIAGFLSTRSS